MCSAAITSNAGVRPQGCAGGAGVANGASALRATSLAAAAPTPLSGSLIGCMSTLRHRSLAVTAAAASGPSSGGSGLGGSPPPSTSFARRRPPPPPQRAAALYSAALDLARSEQFDRARRVFQAAVTADPCLLKAWVSWAQMEKRSIPRGDDGRWDACRTVLQRGLLVNPNAPPLLQAWGLMEMQRGNWVAALLLLDRSARLEPRNTPVLRWKPVVEARRTLGERRRARGQGSRTGAQPGSH
ncbi:hypothetical protein ABPG75_006363 [Micractinium tetrahymenae]